jgi:hypothetical protein
MLDLARTKQPEAQWARREVVDAFDRSGMELPSFMIPFEVPEHLDEDAIGCCLTMMERNLAPSDMILMAYGPAAELIPDTTAQDNAILDMIVQRYAGNPNVNQDELMKLDMSRKLGESIANQLVLPKDHVEAIAIEAVRQQVVELQSIMAGQKVPVSPRDNDMLHLQTMTERLMPLISQVPPNSMPPEMMAALQEAIGHYQAHIQQAEKKGTPVNQTAQFKRALQEGVKHLTGARAQEMPENVAPAAAPHMSGGPGRVSASTMHAVNDLAQKQQNVSQIGGVQGVAAPPRPTTAR